MGNFSNYWDLHTLFTKIKNKIKSVSDKIDDSVSLKIATGNPITLTDAANANAEELLMTIEPVQSGSGDPSPTNVRPISGLTSGEVQTTNGTDTNTATITFGQTVYGGSVNFKTGEVTVTHGIVDMGTLTYNTGSGLFYVMMDSIGAKQSEDSIRALKSSIYINGGMRSAGQLTDYMIASNTSRYFYIKDPRTNTISELITLVTGQTLCYELATPVTLTLTPAELELLQGGNVITGNGAEISIEYYPDNAIGTLAGRVDNKADKEDVDAEIGDLSQTGLTGDSVSAQLGNVKGQIDRFKYNMISPTPLNSYTNNGARTIYQSVMAYINGLSASSRPRGFIQFMITYKANTMPSDLPSHAKWNYAWGEIYFRNIDYADATIILHPFLDDSMIIKQVLNREEKTWRTVLTDKSDIGTIYEIGGGTAYDVAEGDVVVAMILPTGKYIITWCAGYTESEGTILSLNGGTEVLARCSPYHWNNIQMTGIVNNNSSLDMVVSVTAMKAFKCQNNSQPLRAIRIP